MPSTLEKTRFLQGLLREKYKELTRYEVAFDMMHMDENEARSTLSATVADMADRHVKDKIEELKDNIKYYKILLKRYEEKMRPKK